MPIYCVNNIDLDAFDKFCNAISLSLILLGDAIRTRAYTLCLFYPNESETDKERKRKEKSCLHNLFLSFIQYKD